MSESPSVDGLMRVLDAYGIRHGGECSDPAKPYSITVKVPGRGQTNCCGATVREAAQSAFDWLYALPLSLAGAELQIAESEVRTAHATSDCVGGDLPPALSELPSSEYRYSFRDSRFVGAWADGVDLFTAAQMREFALAACEAVSGSAGSDEKAPGSPVSAVAGEALQVLRELVACREVPAAPDDRRTWTERWQAAWSRARSLVGALQGVKE